MMLESLNDELVAFIREQRLFFTATAPASGRINLSPKGLDTLRCLDHSTVMYLDMTGSGNETAAHLKDDGRLTIMFCAFAGKPKILRLYGKGRVVARTSQDWDVLADQFGDLPGVRQIIVLDIESVQTSCGYGVPVFELVEERDTLPKWAKAKGPEGVAEYWRDKNLESIDGLETGLEW